MYEKEKVIRLSNLDDVHEFVGAASKCDFDIDLKYKRILIDAKSLLGVIGIGMNNDFKVCYAGNNTTFEKVVKKFASASHNGTELVLRRVSKEALLFSYMLITWKREICSYTFQ